MEKKITIKEYNRKIREKQQEKNNLIDKYRYEIDKLLEEKRKEFNNLQEIGYKAIYKEIEKIKIKDEITYGQEKGCLVGMELMQEKDNYKVLALLVKSNGSIKRISSYDVTAINGKELEIEEEKAKW